jgi:hypothetical protein
MAGGFLAFTRIIDAFSLIMSLSGEVDRRWLLVGEWYFYAGEENIVYKSGFILNP